MESVQYSHYNLPSPVFSLGGTWNQTLQLLPKQVNGRLAHLAALLFDNVLTPTFTTKPTIVGTLNVATKCDFFDGSILRFQGGFNHLRMQERLHNGGNRVADPDVAPASGAARPFNRVMHMGPPHMAGYPSDFAIPCGLLANGELRLSFGALTDFSADTTAVTVTMRIVAKLVLLDELRIPPAYQFQFQTANTSDFTIAGRGLYLSVALLDSGTFGAISAGDFGNFTLDTGDYLAVPSINAKDLVASYNADFGRGDLLAIQGEPQGAQDVNVKTVDHVTTITALTPVTADLQPVLWTTPDARLSKCIKVEGQLRIKWDGTQQSGVVLFDRILAQPANVVAQAVAKALVGTGLTPKALAPRTLSKKAYTGPYGEFMPWKVKV